MSSITLTRLVCALILKQHYLHYKINVCNHGSTKLIIVFTKTLSQKMLLLIKYITIL